MMENQMTDLKDKMSGIVEHTLDNAARRIDFARSVDWRLGDSDLMD